MSTTSFPAPRGRDILLRSLVMGSEAVGRYCQSGYLPRGMAFPVEISS